MTLSSYNTLLPKARSEAPSKSVSQNTLFKKCKSKLDKFILDEFIVDESILDEFIVDESILDKFILDEFILGILNTTKQKYTF